MTDPTTPEGEGFAVKKVTAQFLVRVEATVLDDSLVENLAKELGRYVDEAVWVMPFAEPGDDDFIQKVHDVKVELIKGETVDE